MKAKPLLVLLVFVLFIALFASGAIGNTDLTPDTPPAPTAVLYDALLSGSRQVVPGRACGGEYSVRPGDTLSRIAELCGVPLANLLSANPSIQNPNMIREGQVIQIYYNELPRAEEIPASAPTVVLPAAQPEAPPEGLRPGGAVHVILKHLPPESPVRIYISREGDQLLLVDERVTDAEGGLSLKVAIPPRAKPGEHWLVTITSGAEPEIKVSSVPFQIEE